MYLTQENRTYLQPLRQFRFDLCETLLEQGSGPINEDSLSTENGVYLVSDGATSLSQAIVENQVSGGKAAADTVVEIFSQNDGSLEDMAVRANRRIREKMDLIGWDLADRKHLWSTSFAAVRITGSSFEWIQTGDCLIVLVYSDGSSRLLVNPPGHDSETLVKWQAVAPQCTGFIHDELAEEISAVRRNMNKTYGVLNGEDEALSFLNSGTGSLEGISDILLFSDGLMLPAKNPASPFDLEKFTELYVQSGVTGIRNYIRSLQRDDPRCCKYPRFKQYDDISAISLKQVQ